MAENRIRRHVPDGTLGQMEILTFDEALAEAQRPNDAYDVNRWLFVPPRYTEYRYLLGTRGRNPLICIGINPSTAKPDALDPTLQSVERIALGHGFDSFIMMNVSAQRATDPDDMGGDYPDVLRQGNAAAFEYALSLCGHPVVWAAWGTMIEKRPYLTGLLRDLVKAGERSSAEWVSFGPRSRKGHPHHPLYLRSDAAMEPFDVNAYLMLYCSSKQEE